MVNRRWYPYALISNTGWYGSIGGGYSIDPSGDRTSGDAFSQSGGHFTSCIVWEILSTGSWTASTGFHLLHIPGYTTSNAINFFGGTSVNNMII